MKAIYLQAAGALALTFGIAACVPQAQAPAPVAPPVATPAPTPTPAPPPPPVVQEPVYDSYLDAPQTEGIWGYESGFDNSTAMFVGETGFHLVLWCDTDTNVVGIDRSVRGPAIEGRIMHIQTETSSRQLPLLAVRDGSLTAQFSARDPILDAMAITKGRIAIGVEGERTLYLPAWVEISRVIEDCR